MCRRTPSAVASAPHTPSVSAVVHRSRERLDPLLKHVGSRHFEQPRPIRRRVRTLLLEVDRLAPELLVDPPTGLLVTLAGVPWRRPLWSWTGGGWTELVRHLLVDDGVCVHPSLLRLPLGSHYQAYRFRHYFGRQFDVLTVIGKGGGLRDLHRDGLLPRTIRRPVWRKLLSDAWTLCFEDAVRRAQLAVHGVRDDLARAFVNHRLTRFEGPEWEHQLDRVMGWLARHADDVQLAHAEAVYGCIETDLRLGRDPTRLTPQRMLQHWQERLAASARRRAPVGPLPQLGIAAWQQERDDRSWLIQELVTGEALAEEGAALNHCVATYAGAVRDLRCSIFSLTANGHRQLTVEVRRRDWSIVQVKGWRNRLARQDERALLSAWARVHGFKEAYR